MKILVLGGNGLIGSKLLRLLQAGGHDAIAASRSSGVDLLTGAGLRKAMAGAATVVDVTNAPSFEDRAVLEFFERSGEQIAAAEKHAGVRHHIALSVVGAERQPDSGYMRAKLVQERLIKAGGIPYTILRATQFMEFLDAIAQFATTGDTVRLPHAKLQPVAADDVAATLAKLAAAPANNTTIELGGEEAIPLDDLIRRVLSARNDPRRVVTDPQATYFGARLDDRTLTTGHGALIGTTRLQDWLCGV